jgi:acetolactate synthase I/II/III large subunit
MAFTIAGTGRPGPAVLLVPADLLNEPAAPSPHRTASFGFFPLDRGVPDAARSDAAVRLLAEADAPLIVAGGAHLSQASATLAPESMDVG